MQAALEFGQSIVRPCSCNFVSEIVLPVHVGYVAYLSVAWMRWDGITNTCVCCSCMKTEAVLYFLIQKLHVGKGLSFCAVPL